MNLKIVIINDNFQDEALEHFHYDQFWSAEHPDYTLNCGLRVYKLQFMTNEAGKIDKIKTKV